MKNKTFECPYLTEEDKEYLKYELKEIGRAHV